jgi:hypothetical protein
VRRIHRGVARSTLLLPILLAFQPAAARQFPNPFAGPSEPDTRAAQAMEPATYRFPARSWRGSSRVLKLRFWADGDFRAVTPAWKIKTRAWLSQLSRMIEPAFGVTFEAESFHEWDRPATYGSLGQALDELKEKDPGKDVDWVVGLVSALPLVTTSVHALGEAQVGTPYFVVRAMGNMNDARAVYANLGKIDPQKKEELYSRRILHKELGIFLHEWAHTLGVLHRGDPRDIMSPLYSPSWSGFAPTTLEALATALARRRPGTTAVAAAPSPEPQPAPEAPPAPAPVPAADQRAAVAGFVGPILEKAREQHRAGDRAGASARLDEAVDRARVLSAPGDPIWLVVAQASVDLGNLRAAEEALAGAAAGPATEAVRARLTELKRAQRPTRRRR